MSRKKKAGGGAGKASRRETPAVRIEAKRSGYFSRPGLLDVVGLVTAALLYVTIARGILYYVPLLQIPLIVGVVVGLFLRAPGNAAVLAGLVVLVGTLALPPFALAHVAPAEIFLPAVVMALGAAACAVAVQGIRQKLSRKTTQLIAWALVLLLIVNLWATTITLNSRVITEDGRSAVDLLREKPVAGEVWSDEDFYRQVVWLMSDDRMGFYEAFQTGYQQNVRWQRDPNTVLGVRMPTAFLFWQSLPAKPWSIILSYLTLASAAGLALTWMTARRSKVVYAVPAVAALSGLVLFVATSRMILNTEPWAVLLAIISVSAGVVALGEDRSTRLLLISVVAATLAVITRELFVYVFVAGIASALMGPAGGRASRVGLWLAGLAVVFAVYAVHAVSASAIVTSTGTAAQWFNGGFSNLLLGLRYATDYIGRTVLVPILFALLALFGAYAAPSREERVYLGLMCALPLIGFLFFGSDAREIATQAEVNYWGQIAVPVLIALSPLGLGALVQARPVPAEDSTTPRR